ncbi:hypothetical protein J7E96_16115 [Streptomyces sp. ISL-96]|uniref:hypothetical protein n=1 Tax=Streptomyces sp. ISL-96 TaxID=2819191 RepID=UPI001BEB03DC|nr:hypothetical protein [Streptomyces sp. ISL-96]MBT2490015.1 hypothetical protein [Streptomyces sp. ISL-96]
MPTRTVKAALALAVVSSLALAAAPAQAGAGSHGNNEKKRQADLAKAYVATAKYLWEPFAPKDGFMRTNDCVADPELGGMGYHYVKTKNIGSTNPARPAALLYEPGKKGEKRKLVAVEYVVVDRDQDLTTDDDRPTMFGGKKFDGPMPGHEPGMPVHYDLHVWLYKTNPKGLFEQWNPTVHCPQPGR